MFNSYLLGSGAPAVASFEVTPSDATTFPRAVRAVTINAGGTLAWRGDDGQVNQTGPLPAGTYPLSADRILATGTTATGITGWV